MLDIAVNCAGISHALTCYIDEDLVRGVEGN